MKTLTEIKEDVYNEMGYKHDEITGEEVDEIALRYATEYAKEALRLASESVFMKVHDRHFKTDSPSKYVQAGANNVQIDKQAIVSENNLPKHR